QRQGPIKRVRPYATAEPEVRGPGPGNPRDVAELPRQRRPAPNNPPPKATARNVGGLGGARPPRQTSRMIAGEAAPKGGKHTRPRSFVGEGGVEPPRPLGHTD